MGSTNGTFVNGTQLTAPQTLNPGDSIGIGQTALIFQIFGPEVAQPTYQAPPEQQPVYTAPAPASSSNQMTQYALYGCGCLLLLCICSLLAIAAWALIDPTSFENATGINVSMRVIEFYLNLG
jgi:hypothetical protein